MNNWWLHKVKEVYAKSSTSNGSWCCPSLITINTNTLFWSNIHFMKEMLCHDQYECCFWPGSRNWSYWYEAWTKDWIPRPRATWEWGGGEFPKPWSARIPPTSSRRGHLLSDTPLFITLWGEISLLRSHVSCKTIQPSEPNLHVISEFENHFRLLSCKEKLSQCHLPLAEYYLVMILWALFSSMMFFINWKGRWHVDVERHRQVFSWVFPCFPSSSSFPVFSPPTKHFQPPGASVEKWRQLFQYLMCLICFVSIACNHT